MAEHRTQQRITLSSPPIQKQWTGLGLALCLGLFACGDGQEDSSSGARTVLLVSLDSVRADFLTFTDSETTPNMCALAERGTIFTAASAPSSWTLPSHTTMFTGAPPALHGVEWDDLAMDKGHATLPEILRADNWFTAGWWTGWFLAGEYGFGRGFDVYDNAMTGGRGIEKQYRAALAAEDFLLVRSILAGRDTLGHQDITTPNVLRALEATISSIDADQDAFLFAHLFDAHYDYIPEAPFDTKFDPEYMGVMDGRGFYKNTAIFDDTKSPARQISERDLDHVRALYQGEIAYIDEYIGRMVEALEKAGRLDNSLIVITADHGDEFFEHGNRGHRQSLSAEVLDVPLLIIQPGGSKGTSDAVVGLTDILPTIAEFAGVPAPATSLGRSLLPAVRGDVIEDKGQLGSLLHYNLFKNEYIFMDSYRTRDTKIIRTMRLDDERNLKLKRVERFALGSDPGELNGNRDRKAIAESPEWAAFQADLQHVTETYIDAGPAPRDERGTNVRELFSHDLAELGYAEASGDSVPGGLGQPWPPGPRPKLKME